MNEKIKNCRHAWGDRTSVFTITRASKKRECVFYKQSFAWPTIDSPAPQNEKRKIIHFLKYSVLQSLKKAIFSPNGSIVALNFTLFRHVSCLHLRVCRHVAPNYSRLIGRFLVCDDAWLWRAQRRHGWYSRWQSLCHHTRAGEDDDGTAEGWTRPSQGTAIEEINAIVFCYRLHVKKQM